jgi:hypothetical protein
MNDFITEDQIEGLPKCGPDNVPEAGDIVVRLSGKRLSRGMLFECVDAYGEDNDIGIRLLAGSSHPIEGEVEQYLDLNRFAIYKRGDSKDEPI